MIDIIDVIDSVVDSMRKTGSILSIVDNADNTYTITVSDIENLSDNDYITISNTTNFDGEYQITSVSGVTFSISKTSGEATETGDWKANAPYYLYGHLRDIIQVNAAKDKNPSTKSQKYPLIILALDVDKIAVYKNIDYTATTSIIIANTTEPDWRSSKRKEQNFDPILHPLYNEFMQAIIDSTYIQGSFLRDFEGHKPIDRYYWGRITLGSGNDAHKLNEHLDAIEITNLELGIFRQKQSNC